ncbi:glutamyl/tRNA (Gln) amidotransferase subunit C [Legionella rubrilucens]|uniref:Aspartyl/glutamyl-tRNA(Asn/Gln) amidotransferase subunit C n=1 Tax=Legionella rubrilucens TaxID=458 RepID=A0A0W0Y244_9GAMM|nr:Asp-tRNA(Asn)/Glu-tRNA(Gln) amidotransferase subunit GatC [Legionella rubrilucens]KTD50611.1 glutamyl/tRNA (Gln) amidotransferase subunit C [Legionella rubrilucens]
MTISSAELQAIAELACLDSDYEDSLSLVLEVNGIIDFVAELRQLDTRQVAPLFHPYELHQRLRDDEMTESNCVEELEQLAPLFEEGFYLVPKVIDSGK